MGIIVADEAGDKECLLRNQNLWSNTASFPRMVFLGVVVVSPGILAGMTAAISGIALPQMDLNIEEASWFGSISAFGSVFGSVSIGLVVDRFGRRPAILLGIFPSIVGWFMICIDGHYVVSLIGRLLMGVTGGTTFLGQIYTAECILVNHVHLRNSFNTWDSISTVVGTLSTYILGVGYPYQQVASIVTVLSIVFFVAVYVFIPESPDWLHKHGYTNAARLSEYKLRIYQPVLDGPAAAGAAVQASSSSSSSSTSSSSTLSWSYLKKALQKLQRKDVHKPTILLSVWFALIAFSGGPAVGTYMVDALTTEAHVENSTSPSDTRGIEYKLSVGSGVCSLLAVILLSFVVTRTGIKKLFAGSAICMAMALLAIGTLKINVVRWSTTLNVLHTLAVWTTVFFYYFGVLTAAGSVIGEMFPYDAKGFACVPMVCLCLMFWLAVKVHLYWYVYFQGWLYIVYSTVTLLSAIYVAIFIPETVGRKLDEIREEFLR